jgi:hypothetical protein
MREEGDRVLTISERREWPLDGSWAGWRPDPDWEVPTLPSGWDTIQ